MSKNDVSDMYLNKQPKHLQLIKHIIQCIHIEEEMV